MYHSSVRWKCWHFIALVLSQCFVRVLSEPSGTAEQPRRRIPGSPKSGDGHYFEFVTRQDIHAPVWDIIRNNNKTLQAPGYWFIAPYEEKTQTEPGGKNIGPHIYDSDGELIWSGAPFFGHWNIFDFTVANVSGEPHLAMQDWHGQRGVIMDSSYEILKTAPMLGPGDTFQNMHAFHVVNDGSRGLPLTIRREDTSNERSIADLGYNGSCAVGFQGFRELDLTKIGTPIVFEWEPRDHVSLNESTYIKNNHKDYDGTAATMCKRGWDAMHVNSVDKFADGDYLLSARHSDTLYKISHMDGHVVWRLGGKLSDFEFINDAEFARQHHGEVIEQNSTHILISLFDNAIGEGWQMPLRRFSRGLVLSLDMQNMTATTVGSYGHPKGQLSTGRGSMQVLANGNAFVGWADDSHISEHLADGSEIVLEAVLPARIQSYRSFKFPWVGRPKQPPDVHSETVWGDDHGMETTISMSWNGATEVREWGVYGYDDEGKEVHIATVPQEGFETTVTYSGLVANVYAEARDRNGNLLGTSKDGGRVWPERIPKAATHISVDLPAISPKAYILTLLGVGGGFLVIIVGAIWLYRRHKRKEISEAKEKGEYQQLGQEEEASDD